MRVRGRIQFILRSSDEGSGAWKAVGTGAFRTCGAAEVGGATHSLRVVVLPRYSHRSRT
jgi:hypothetical protein